MGGIQTKIPDGNIGVERFKFAQGDDGADAVVPSGIEESDVEGKVNTRIRVVGAKHVEGVAKIKSPLVTVPAPVRIGVREMAFAVTVQVPALCTFAGLMPIRGGMGMDAGAVAGEGDAVLRNQPVAQGREDGGEPENLLEPFFIMEGELLVCQCIIRNGIGDSGMFVGKFLSFAGFIRGFRVFILWEKILPAGFLGIFGLEPEPVHEIKVRPQRREGIWGAADQEGKQAVGLQFLDPGGKAGKTEHCHKHEGAEDLGLVFGRPAGVGKEAGKVCHNGIQIQQPEFFTGRGEFKMKPGALGRIKMYFCLMQEIQIILMGLPVH